MTASKSANDSNNWLHGKLTTYATPTSDFLLANPNDGTVPLLATFPRRTDLRVTRKNILNNQNKIRRMSNQEPGQGDIQRRRPWPTHCESAKVPRLNLSMGWHWYLHAAASMKTTDAQLIAQIYLAAGLVKNP